MILVAWNCQGSNGGQKWDALWSSFLYPVYSSAANKHDVFAYVTEAGVAPWIAQGQSFKINTSYKFNDQSTAYSPLAALKSNFCKDMSDGKLKFKRSAAWMPWVRNINAKKINARCSMAVVNLFYPSNGTTWDHQVFPTEVTKRPVVRSVYYKGSIPVITIFLVHLVSGIPKTAIKNLAVLIKTLNTQIPTNSAALIIGDMNINLLVPAQLALLQGKLTNSRIIRTNAATQKSGGELDFGILFDPNKQYTGATAQNICQYKTGPNDSDHAVIQYIL